MTLPYPGKPTVSNNSQEVIAHIEANLEYLEGVRESTFALKFTTRGTLDISGNEVFTGIGFQPSALIAFSKDEGIGVGYSVGVHNADGTYCVYENNSGTPGYSAHFIYLYDDATVYDIATVVSLDSDGFTLNWNRAGNTGSRTIVVCMR